MQKISRVLYALPVVIGVVYLTLTITSKAAHGPGMDLVARLSIVVPEIIIWCLATLGAVRMKTYAYAIRQSEDGRSLNAIANALLLVVLYIILLSMRNAIAHPFIHTPYLRLVVGLRNYLPIVVLMTAAILLFIGSRRLVHMAPGNIWNRSRFTVFNLVCILCFTAYVVIFYRFEPFAASIGGVPRFTLPLTYLVVSYVIPYLFIWALGLLSCMYLAYYSSNVAGKIYRALFRDLYAGLLIIFAGIFIAQLGVISRFAGTHHFSAGILPVYALLALIGTGSYYLWSGSRALAKIERY